MSLRGRRLLLCSVVALTVASAPCVTVALATRPRDERARPPRARAALTVGVLDLIDRSRRVDPARGPSRARRLVTELFLPTGPGPHPLLVFAHGFSVTPDPYRRLLRAWAGAGYVVAAPVFPLESAGAPGGPDESDLPNQPRDVSFVISALLARSREPGGLAGVIDPSRIALVGQSDGGATVLADGYATRLRDRRARAVVVLSGAELPGFGDFSYPPGSPPLLVVQGTADAINLPRESYAIFAHAHRPKFLLRLLGAKHLPPYTAQQPQLGIVTRSVLDFLARYLNADPAAAARLEADGSVPDVAQLTAVP